MLRVMKQKVAIDGFRQDAAAAEQLPAQERWVSTVISPSEKKKNLPSSSSSNDKGLIVSHIPISVGSKETLSSISSTSTVSSSSSFKQGDAEGYGLASSDESPAETTSSLFELHHGFQKVEAKIHPKNVNNNSSLTCSDRPLKKARTRQEANGATIEISPLLSRALGSPSDSQNLPSLHVFIRYQIEVFSAGKKELAQPAPGRKSPIQLGQVGLRCLHCKHLPIQLRTKRSESYPNKVNRIYSSVSDFKFDHFQHCPQVPPQVREQFQLLKQFPDQSPRPLSQSGVDYSSRKATAAGSKGVTQYYHQDALRMGMIDGEHGGIFWRCPSSSPPTTTSTPSQPQPSPEEMSSPTICLPTKTSTSSSTKKTKARDIKKAASSVCTTSADSSNLPELEPALISQVEPISLSTSEDKKELNELHCFVRRSLEVFAANDTDVAAPAPGRKTRISLGQVGIRCVFCAKLPVKSRVKRSVCYPPTVDGIYHAVSNMKHDHFDVCKGISEATRKEFCDLKVRCTRRGSSSASSSGSSSSKGQHRKNHSKHSTSLFYTASAKRLGLVDTPTGVRFSKRASLPAEKTTGGPEMQRNRSLSLSDSSSSSAFSALVMAACQAV